jgi:hypothetical protein
MNCKHCGNLIPEKRVDMGYRECVNCSTVTKWSGAAVNYHKTGNTTEIIKDPEVAREFAYMSARKGFGVLKGMTSQKKPNSVFQKKAAQKILPAAAKTFFGGNIVRVKPTYYFEEVGKEMMDMLESSGYAQALQHIKDSLENRRIYKKQADQLISILKTLFNENKNSIS